MNHEPPAHLDDAAADKWREIATALDTARPGVADALAAYCVAWSRWTAAEQQVAVLGAVVKSPSGFPVANPYLAVAKYAQRQLRQWGDVLGLHRRNRRKAEDGGEGDQDGSDILRLLG